MKEALLSRAKVTGELIANMLGLTNTSRRSCWKRMELIIIHQQALWNKSLQQLTVKTLFLSTVDPYNTALDENKRLTERTSWIVMPQCLLTICCIVVLANYICCEACHPCRVRLIKTPLYKT